jgi:HD-GYP domain-containing protein (c-di-GMP phosphodiesterase class II)
VTNEEKWGPRLNAECGVTEIIHKPLTGGQMLSKINSAVASSQKAQHVIPDQANDADSSCYRQNEIPGKNLESVISNEVVAILQSFKAKSDSVYAHSIHVAYTAVGISDIVRSHGNGLSRQILGNEQMFLAGLLHDTGKLNVPNRILFKDSELTQRERETMNLHAVWGADYLSNIKSLRDYAVYAYQHHEPSYPKALPIDGIAVSIRVISTADKFSAMIVNRRYRNAIPPESTVEMLKPQLQQFFGKCADPIANYLRHITFTELSKKEQIVSDTVFTHRT